MKQSKKLKYLMLITSIISIVIYLLLACFVSYKWQKAVVSLEGQDPIWQLIYPFIYIPIIAFVFGLFDGWKSYWWYILILVAIVSPVIGIVSNDGSVFHSVIIKYLVGDLLYFIIPDLITALIGIGLSKIIKIIVNAILKRFP